MQLIDDFLHLLYPSGCFVCEKELSKFENHLCSFCLEKISLTNFHLFEEKKETNHTTHDTDQMLLTHGMGVSKVSEKEFFRSISATPLISKIARKYS